MTENLEERLRLCSTRFNHPDKAYPLLKLAAEQGKFQYIETQVPTLHAKKNKKTGEKAILKPEFSNKMAILLWQSILGIDITKAKPPGFKTLKHSFHISISGSALSHSRDIKEIP